jgi:PrtD family type I secretion system ABC transporter
MLQTTFNNVLRLTLVLSVFTALLNLVVPLNMMILLRWVLPSDHVQSILPVMLLAIGGLVFMTWFDLLRFAVLRRFARYLNASLGEAILLRVFRDQAQQQRSEARAALMDLKRVRQFLTTPTAVAILDSAMIPLKLLIVFFISAAIGIVAVLSVLTIAALKWLRRHDTREQLKSVARDTQQAAALAEEGVEHAQTVQAMGMREQLLRRWRAIRARAITNQSAVHESSGTDSAVFSSLGWSMQIIMMGVGYGLMFGGGLDGSFAIIAVIIAARTIMPLQGLLGGWQQTLEAKESFLRLKAYVEAQEAQQQEGERLSLPAPRGQLQAQGLTYRRGKAVLLKGISFNLKPGLVMGLVGASGAGKSTLARLLAGAEPPSGGLLRLDGADLTQWNRDQLGPHIGYLPQEIELFAGTLGENIARFQTDADPEAIAAAAARAGLSELVAAMPNGYDTLLEEGGSNLPGGLRQRIGLARALFTEPQVLILDEPDAYLDQAGRQALEQLLREAPKRGTTLVLVTHTQSLLRFAHLLLVLDDGKVQHYGPTKKVVQAMREAATAKQGKPAPPQQGTAKPAPESGASPAPGQPAPAPAAAQASGRAAAPASDQPPAQIPAPVRV